MTDKAIGTGGSVRLIALAVVALVLWAPAGASAAPPSMTLVPVNDGASVQWTLPAGMKTYSIEVGVSPRTYEEGDNQGSFWTENWVASAILIQWPQTTSWSVSHLPSGTYYAHVSAIDGTTCTSPLALGCPKEWSDTVTFFVPNRSLGLRIDVFDRTPRISWCCEGDLEIELLEIATAPDVYSDGPSEGLFLDENLVLVAAPPPNQSSYSSRRPLAGGRYYVHAVGLDHRYCPTYDPARRVCEGEVSKAVPFIVAATPPVLLIAQQLGGAIQLVWSLPNGVGVDFVEVATAPDTYLGGSLRGAFRDDTVVLYDDDLFWRQRSYTAAEPLPPGTYYAHVAAWVAESCTTLDFPPGCFDDYSETARITIPRSEPAANQTNTMPDAGLSDQAIRFSVLRARKVQSVRRLSVVAMIEEDASVRAVGRVRVSRSTRTFKLRSVNRHLGAGRPATLRLKLSRRSLATVLRAIARHRSVKARLSIMARDRAGNEVRQMRTVRLRR